MNLRRFSLVDKGIVYDKEVAKDSQCPPHAESLRACIRDFSYPVPGFSTPNTLESLLAHVEAHPNTTDQRVCLAKEIRQEAIRLKRNDFSEATWSDFFHKQFFDQLEACTRSPKHESRISSRNHFYYDAIVSQGDQLWDVFQRDSSCYQHDHCPKPDAAFYLPIYDTSSTISVDSSVAFRNTYWQQAPDPTMAEPFSWSTLNRLNMHAGLEPCPRKICDKKTRNKSAEQLRCYPWLIVEFKKAHMNDADSRRADEIACCQANNAAACALQLNRQLARYAIPRANEGHVLPLPAVTTNGPNVTIWVAYYAKDVEKLPRFGCIYGSDGVFSDAYAMQAVWKGDMTNLEDILAFEMALENIYTWAIRIFKPLVASYINQWVSVHLQQIEPGTSPHVPKQVENYQTVIPMVNSLLREYQTLEFESKKYADGVDPLHFGLVLSQMVGSDHKSLLKEIDRILTEKLEHLVRIPGYLLTGSNNQQSSERGQSQRESTAGEANQNSARGSPDCASIYYPGSSDDEGSHITRASQTATHQANLKRSTRSNQNFCFERPNSITSDTQQTSGAGVTPEGTPKFRSTTPIDLTADETDMTTPTAGTVTTSGSLLGTPSTTASTVTTPTKAIVLANRIPATSPRAIPHEAQALEPSTQRSTSPSPVDEGSANSSGSNTHPKLNEKLSPDRAVICNRLSSSKDVVRFGETSPCNTTLNFSFNTPRGPYPHGTSPPRATVFDGSLSPGHCGTPNNVASPDKPSPDTKPDRSGILGTASELSSGSKNPFSNLGRKSPTAQVSVFDDGKPKNPLPALENPFKHLFNDKASSTNESRSTEESSEDSGSARKERSS